MVAAACERLEAARIELGERIRNLRIGLLDSPLESLPGLINRAVRHFGRRNIAFWRLIKQIDRTVDQRGRMLRVLPNVAFKRFPAMVGLHGERHQHRFLNRPEGLVGTVAAIAHGSLIALEHLRDSHDVRVLRVDLEALP
ncbi:hypothetical protein G6F24_016278 [Rhizopus arrhizus]|nr:hypothetical protein G6F24_016278 [Rhizopus arrhizus]